MRQMRVVRAEGREETSGQGGSDSLIGGAEG